MSQNTKYTNLRFLIVDHSAMMRRMVRHSLKEAGYLLIEEIDTCVGAMQKLQQKNHDFVIVELNFPNMDGLSFLKTIRADAELANMPVLIISSYSRKADVVAAAQAGANDYVLKPFSINILTRKIIRIMDKISHSANQQA